MTEYKVRFLPSGKEATVPLGTTIYSAACLAGAYVSAPCGGGGTCGACQVHITGGDGVTMEVMACQYMVTRDLTVTS